MQLKQKVELKAKGQSIELKPKGGAKMPFHAALKWTSSVDLDLRCIYRLKEEAIAAPAPAPSSGFFGKIKGALSALAAPSRDGQVFTNLLPGGSHGKRNAAPWITLDGDSGVGNVGGQNEENMHFWNIDNVETALIVVNNFGAPNHPFSSHDGKVVVTGGDSEFTVPLDSPHAGSWCVVALIDNKSGTPTLTNINSTSTHQPQLSEYA